MAETVVTTKTLGRSVGKCGLRGIEHFLVHVAVKREFCTPLHLPEVVRGELSVERCEQTIVRPVVTSYGRAHLQRLNLLVPLLNLPNTSLMGGTCSRLPLPPSRTRFRSGSPPRPVCESSDWNCVGVQRK